MTTSRELVKKALSFEKLHRIPREMYFDNEYLLKNFPSDVASPPFQYFSDKRSGVINSKGFWTDEWGCVWEAAEEGVKGEVKHSPLENWENLKSFIPPFEILKTADLSKVNEAWSITDKFMISFWETAASPFQRMQFLRGTENLFMDLAYGEDELIVLRDMVHDYFMQQVEMWAKTDVDGIHIEDDWGSQNSTLISPELWREFFKPLYLDYCKIAHSYGKHVIMHSDGFIEPIIEDLIEIGVNAINSQIFCMDMKSLADKYAGRICFWGEIDRQNILPFGSPEDVHNAVLRIRKALRDDKGGVIAQCEWGKNNPVENIEKVFQTWEEEIV